MQVINTFIEDLVIVQPRFFSDNRGYFFESYNYRDYEKNGLPMRFVQDNISKSQKGVLRGLHFQKPPYEQGKLVQVLKGEVLDVAVDLRRESLTYGQHFTIKLNEENKTQLYIPAGFAHGFATLKDETVFAYKCTNYYHKESEDSIYWNDKTLGIDWLIENPIVSDKDQIKNSFDNFISPF